MTTKSAYYQRGLNLSKNSRQYKIKSGDDCCVISKSDSQDEKDTGEGEGGKGLLPSLGHIGMCSPKKSNLSAALVIKKESILADFGHFGHK